MINLIAPIARAGVIERIGRYRRTLPPPAANGKEPVSVVNDRPLP